MGWQDPLCVQIATDAGAKIFSPPPASCDGVRMCPRFPQIHIGIVGEGLPSAVQPVIGGLPRTLLPKTRTIPPPFVALTFRLCCGKRAVGFFVALALHPSGAWLSLPRKKRDRARPTTSFCSRGERPVPPPPTPSPPIAMTPTLCLP